jgi:hypothetical protein
LSAVHGCGGGNENAIKIDVPFRTIVGARITVPRTGTKGRRIKIIRRLIISATDICSGNQAVPGSG